VLYSAGVVQWLDSMHVNRYLSKGDYVAMHKHIIQFEMLNVHLQSSCSDYGTGKHTGCISLR